MAGHSKWANIKHRKARQDAKRGKVFTRLIRDIMTSARMGGGDAGSNPSLRKALDEARAENMTKDTIERAIKRGTGEIQGADYEEIAYEGYGPGNVAIIVKCLTDNKTRTVANVRSTFTKHGGRFGEAVMWLFAPKGLITYPAAVAGEDAMMEAAIEGGADDVSFDGETHDITCAVEDFGALSKHLAEKFGKPEEAELGYVANQKQPITDAETAEKLMKLINTLEDDDDVQTVTTNVEMDDAIAEKLAS